MPSDEEVLEGSVFLPLDASTHLCIQDLFSYACNQGSSLSTTPMGEEYYTEWVTGSTDKLWQDRGDACPGRVMFTDREAGKAATPQPGVSVSHLLIAHADLGSVWKHRYYKKTFFLSSSKWDVWISSTPRRGSPLCVSLLTQGCRVEIFPSWTETVGPVLSQFVHASCSRDSTCCLTSEEHTPVSLQYPFRQFSMLISRAINTNFADSLRGGLSTLYFQPKINEDAQVDGEGIESAGSTLWWSPRQNTYSRKEPIWKESCLGSSPVRFKMFDSCRFGMHVSKHKFNDEVNFYVLRAYW